jgi:diguanylate cyclase (GGDEF)-like protein
MGEFFLAALDGQTLATVLLIVCTILTGLLGLTWLQNRSVPAFGLWTISFGLCAVAAGFVVARNLFPGLLAIDIANALRFLAFGIAWHGARRFGGRKGSWTIAAAPALLWIALTSLSALGEDLAPRVLIASPVVAAFAFAIAAELWRASPRVPWIARLAAVLFIVHGTVFASRFVYVLLGASAQLDSHSSIAGPFHPVAILEGLILAVALAFLLMSATKDEIGRQHRDAALVDPLTGVLNRRGFEAEAGRMLSRAARDGSSTALLALDLDHFKSVNDTWGHPVGDLVLRAVAKTIAAELRGGDVVGRLGGEEFVIALAGSRTEYAALLAERVRRAVAALPIRGGATSIDLTVSIGVAAHRGATSFEKLMMHADAALYRAKAAGRNRVELAPTLITARIEKTVAVEPLASRAA